MLAVVVIGGSPVIVLRTSPSTSVARVLFLALTSCGNTTTPHPAGDHKGPPNPASSALAPTDHLVLCLVSQLRLMHIGEHLWSPLTIKSNRNQVCMKFLQNALVERCQELDVVAGLRHVL